MPFSAIFNPAGGLTYHARARRFSRSLWAPFRAALAPWLAERTSARERLILVGPSAGYCLDDGFLRRFADVLVLDPDPVAAWLLKSRLRRLGVASVRSSSDDLLIAPLLRGEPGLAALLEREPDALIVFCNVLGQVRFLLSEAEFEQWLSAFRERVLPELAGREWLSFHDRLSGTLAPELPAPFRSARALDERELVAQFYVAAPQREQPFELIDHHTARIWPAALPRAYFSWQLLPDRYHLIEGVAGVGHG